MRITRVILTMGVVLAASATIAEEAKLPTQRHTEEQGIRVLDEVLVVGTQPGPPLWQVRSGDRILWVLAQVRYVGKDVKWRSQQVEDVLTRAQEVLVVHGAGDTPAYARPTVELTRAERNSLSDRMRNLPSGKTLREVLPSDLYSHLEDIRTAFPGRDENADREMEKHTPDWARNELWNRALRALQLGLTPVTDQVVDMARRRRVKVTIVEPLVWTRFVPIPNIESAMDICRLDELLHELDGRGSRWVARANAWATGNIERMTQFVSPFPLQRPQCEGPLTPLTVDRTLDAQHKAQWLAALERSLKDNDVSLAVVDASVLLAAGGLLEILRSRGYEVVSP